MLVRAFTPLCLFVLFMAGCGDGGAEPQLEWEEVVGLHFEDGYLATTFGSTLVDIWAGGQIVGDPLVILPGLPTRVEATFHDAASNLIMGLDEYELRIVPGDPTLLIFTPTGPFAGTVTRLRPGATVLQIGLHNTQRQLEDFGPFAVPVTIR
jgi:hypothetical protein